MRRMGDSKEVLPDYPNTIFAAARDYVGEAWRVREGSTEQSGVQGVFLLKSLIPAFALLLVMAGFAIAVRAGAILRGER